MSTSICRNCLSRLRIQTPSTVLPSIFIAPTAAPFSTTSQQYALPMKAKKSNPGGSQERYRVSRSARASKKRKDRPRPPAPGERQAQRKRIVLSNTNALEVQGLETLSLENMADAAKTGQMLALNGPLLDQLRESKSFKTTQNWSMFRQPSILMRQETIGLGEDIQEVSTSQQDQGFGAVCVQKIVTGEQGSGKSIHLLQAQSMAFMKGWVVVSIPECQDFVINTSSYLPVPVEEGQEAPTEGAQLYDQPKLAAQILSRVASSNTKILKSLKLIHAHPKNLPFKVTKTSTLFNLAEAGANDPPSAPAIFHAFWKELTQPSTSAGTSTNDAKTIPRPPVLVTLDGINRWMGSTLYRSSDHKIVHAHQFTLIQHFLSLLFPDGQSNPLPQGGMILAATSASSQPHTPSFTTILSQIAALQAGVKPSDPSFPVPSPYSKTDPRVLELMKNAGSTGLMELKGLSKLESKGLLEYFAKSGVLRDRVSDAFVGEKWSLSGGGVVGELAKLGRRIRV